MNKEDYDKEIEKEELEIPDDLKEKAKIRKAASPLINEAIEKFEESQKELIDNIKDLVERVNVKAPEIQKTEVTNQPETQKVEVTNQQQNPDTQKVEVTNQPTPPDVQKVSLVEKIVTQIVKFPMIQKIKGSISVNNLPETQDVVVKNPVEKVEVSGLEKLINAHQLPTGEVDKQGNLQKGSANPAKFLNVRLTDGKNFRDVITGAFNTVMRVFVGSDGVQKPALVDENGHIQADITDPLDRNTGSLKIIPLEHEKIHEGESFKADVNVVDLDSNPLNISFWTPVGGPRSHLTAIASSTGEAMMSITEAPSGGVAGGRALEAINRDRNSTNESTLSGTHGGIDSGVTEGASAPTGGKQIHHFLFGTGQNKIGGEARDLNEFILKQNTEYAVTMSGTVNNVRGQLTLNWYEHSNLT